MQKLIVTPFLENYLVLRPGSAKGVKISEAKYRQLAQTASDEVNPDWLAQVARDCWGLDIHSRPVGETTLVRQQSRYGFARCSYELNLFCNLDCKICYLGVKVSAGLTWSQRERLLHIMRDSGVVWLQLTGGEPMIDRFFPEVYTLSHELGMMISISSNGSNLSSQHILELFDSHRPYRLTLSVYGASEESYEGQTQRRGSYTKFIRGLDAAHEAGLPVKLSLIVTKDSEHEVDQMKALADHYGWPYHVYANMSPTIYGGDESLPSQSAAHMTRRKVFTGCNAGHTHYHVDPLGKASICKVGREPNIPLMEEGVEGLLRLGAIGDSLLTRQGGCSGCQLSGSCGTCMPLATLYRQAKAPLASYCQHG